MTRIDFYRYVANPENFACRLARKVYATQAKTGQKLVILCQESALDQLDKALWSLSALDFIPHAKAHESHASQSPIVLTSNETSITSPHTLLNLTPQVPSHFARFERLLEIVPQDEAGKSLARDRYRYYRERGYQLATHDVELAA